jgi:hypothetical protein
MGPLSAWSMIDSYSFILSANFGSLPPGLAISGHSRDNFSASVELPFSAYSIARELLIENSENIRFIKVLVS